MAEPDIEQNAMLETNRFRLSVKDFSYVGTDLSRPECIVACPDGVLFNFG